MGCSNSKYLEVFTLPKYYFNLNIKKYNTLDKITEYTLFNCTDFRKGKEIPKEFPVQMSLDKNALIKFITDTPIARFFEYNNFNELIIKLNTRSKYHNLNNLSSILRDHLDFKNIVLIFNNKKNSDSLQISHIFYEDELIDDGDAIWSTLIRSAYTELTLIMLIEYSICNLQLANILNTTHKEFYWIKMGEYITSQKIKEIKYLFGSNIIFNQKLENNVKFLKYVKTFDFHQFYNLNKMNVKWINDTKKTIEEVKTYVKKYNFESPDSKIMLEVLFLISKIYNENPYKFMNIIYTDAFYIPQMKKEGMGFLLNNTI